MKRVRTKIICTLGPASSTPRVLRKMVRAGMDVARLNFSHGTHKSHLKSIRLVRAVNTKYKRGIKILQDLEGFRVRIGDLAHWPGRVVALKKNERVFLSNDPRCFRPGVIPFDYEGTLQVIRPGSHIYIDDGNIALRVTNTTKDQLKAIVEVAGVVKEHKGINIPEAKLSFSKMTPKDHRDLVFGITQGVDLVAQSFVRNKKDIVEVRKVLDRHKSSAKLIAKIENKEGVDNVDRILSACDGVMIARGDLGVCLPIYEIPFLQKMLIKKCKEQKKIVITATQMLESMTEHLRPTRAEVTDVANAIIDGTDYLMLSAESAAGRYPVEAVKMMNDIAKSTEHYLAAA